MTLDKNDKIVTEVFRDVREQLAQNMEDRVYGGESALAFNEILFRQFSKPRNNGSVIKYEPIFIG